MIVSIHQPQYIPWAGYIYKILMSDVFVLFDTVQYPMGKGFANRNQIKTVNGPLLLTIPVGRRGEKLSFREIPIADSMWRKKHWGTINNAYKSAPYFDLIVDDLKCLYEREWNNLVDFNEAILVMCLDFMKISTKIVRASSIDIDHTYESPLPYIISICKALEGDEYLTGKGAGSLRYIEPEAFQKEGLKLCSYEFIGAQYKQIGSDFLPDLSILDMLFNHGSEARSIIENSGELNRDPAIFNQG
jgi:hypothetical protein